MTIQELYETGHIKLLFNRGLLSADVLGYFDYVDHYSALKASGMGYRKSIEATALRFRVSDSTVKRAVRLVAGSKL